MNKTRYNKLAAESNLGNGTGAAVGREFQLDQRLAADSFKLLDWPLCELRRFDDSRYDWLLLIPRVAECTEFLDLNQPQQQALATEVKQAAALLKAHGSGQKLNVGALGNLVPQLHIHLMLRHPQDPAWPGPVWGHSAALRFTPAQREQEIKRWQALL